MNIVRKILAFLITVSLMLAPGASAFATAQDRAPQVSASSTHGDMSMPDTSMAGMDMSDCMKAMARDAAANNATKSDCKCCDTKSKCPDQASCMTKCCKVLGTLKPSKKVVALTTIQYRQTEPAEPPSWVNAPPAPPPRS